MSQKEQITRAWLEKYTENTELTLDLAMSKWWRNTHHGRGFKLRLTQQGLDFAVEVLKLPTFEFDIGQHIAGIHAKMLYLDRYCPCPYYIRSVSRTLFLVLLDSKEAMTYIMFNGLDQYLKNLVRQYQD